MGEMYPLRARYEGIIHVHSLCFYMELCFDFLLMLTSKHSHGRLVLYGQDIHLMVHEVWRIYFWGPGKAMEDNMRNISTARLRGYLSFLSLILCLLQS